MAESKLKQPRVTIENFRENYSNIQIIMALSIIAILSGGILVRFNSVMILGLALSVCLILVGINKRVFIVVFVSLIAVNALPFIDISNIGNVGNLKGSDIALVVGLFFSFIWWYIDRKNDLPGHDKIILYALLAFTVIWVLQVIRATLFEEIPIKYAFLYGRDYLGIIAGYFFINGLRNLEELKKAYIALMIIGVIFAIAYIFQALKIVELDLIIHGILKQTDFGVYRIYSSASVLSDSFFCVAVGMFLFSKRLFIQIAGTVATLILGAHMILQQSRMNYITILFGLLFALIFVKIIPKKIKEKKMNNYRMQLVLIAGLFLTFFIFLFNNYFIKIFDILFGRIMLGFSDITSFGGTFGKRIDWANSMYKFAQGRILTGLGFLHPYVFSSGYLPKEGALKNIDMGALSMIITMGLPATLLYYISIARSAYLSIKEKPIDIITIFQWGIGAYLIAVIVSAPTLLRATFIIGLLVGLVYKSYSIMNEPAN